ncbi:hypothetical protein GQ457_18G006260 [Hibiscus cannabinus]
MIWVHLTRPPQGKLKIDLSLTCLTGMVTQLSDRPDFVVDMALPNRATMDVNSGDGGMDLEMSTLGIPLTDDGMVKTGETPDESNMVVVTNMPSNVTPIKPSFRDMVWGTTSEVQKDSFICDIDVELQENNVVIVHKQIDVKLSKSLIVRLLGKSIGYRALNNRIYALWALMGEVNLIDLYNDYYFVRFSMEDNYDKILGWFDYLDYRTDTIIRTCFSKCGRFTRLVIMVDRDKPLIPGLISCFGCGKYGHSKDVCGQLSGLNEVPKPIETPLQVETKIYGSLMQVERRQCRTGTISRQENRENEAPTTLVGSHNSVGQKKVTAGGREIGRLKEGHNSGLMPRERYVVSIDEMILETNVDVLVVVAHDKVGTAPTSLKSNKHVVIHVVEEGAKRVLKESNSRSSYGPIRKDPYIVAIMESRVSAFDVDNFIRRSGFDYSYRMEATEFSIGIWVMWKDSNRLDIIVMSLMWDQLCALDPRSEWSWVLGGDFNGLIVRDSLRSMGTLARGWINVFAMADTMWNEHQDIERHLKENWDNTLSMFDSLSKFQETTRRWNKDVFGHIGRQKARLLAVE